MTPSHDSSGITFPAFSMACDAAMEASSPEAFAAALQTVRALIAQGAQVDERWGTETALMRCVPNDDRLSAAARERRLELARVLIDEGHADLSLRVGRNNHSIVFHAWTFTPHNMAMVELLMSKGARCLPGSSEMPGMAQDAVEADRPSVLALLMAQGLNLRAVMMEYPDSVAHALPDMAIVWRSPAALEWLLSEGGFTLDDVTLHDRARGNRCGPLLQAWRARQAARAALDGPEPGLS